MSRKQCNELLLLLKATTKSGTKRRRYIVSFIARHFITETFSFWVTSERQTHLVGAARQSKNYGKESGESRGERVRVRARQSSTWASTWTTKTFKKELILFSHIFAWQRCHSEITLPFVHSVAFYQFERMWKFVTSQMSQLVLQNQPPASTEIKWRYVLHCVQTPTFI